MDDGHNWLDKIPDPTHPNSPFTTLSIQVWRHLNRVQILKLNDTGFQDKFIQHPRTHWKYFIAEMSSDCVELSSHAAMPFSTEQT